MRTSATNHLFLYISLLIVSTTKAANIGFYGGAGVGSHFAVPAALGKELVRRGHNVTAIISGDMISTSTDERYAEAFHWAITNQRCTPDVVQERMDRFARAAVSGNFMREVTKNNKAMRADGLADCEALLNDDEFVLRLRAEKLDLLMVDPFIACGTVLPDLLDIPFVMVLPTPIDNTIASVYGSGIHPALHPALGSGLPFSMDFWQRFKNLLRMYVMPSIFSMNIAFSDDFRKSRGIVPDIPTAQTVARAELFLINSDFAVEFGYPSSPNVISVGGITTAPAKALYQDLEDFVQSSGEAGVIVFSLGTYATFMKDELVLEFAQAFSRLPQKVIWKTTRDLSDLTDPDKIRALSWIPQNDLLGHEKTKAFIFHGGNNGFYEVVSQGVPCVVIPLLVDQFDVATRILHHGLGLDLDYHSLNANKIEAAINTVITNSSYKANAKRISAIFHDSPMTPVKKAAFWVEHVIKYGGAHLRTPIHTLKWWQYYLLDIFAFLLACLIIVGTFLFYIIKLTIRLVRWLSCKTRETKEQKTD